MSIRTLIYNLAQTRCVSNQLILKVCQQYYQVNNDFNYLKNFVSENLKIEKRKKFQQLFEQTAVCKENFITFFDSCYPAQLRQIYNPPAILYYVGNLKLLGTSITAIVGARQCNYYTAQVIKGLVPRLVAQEITTVSGLAKGADGYCHRETLACQGKTIAVIGNSLDYFYPAENHLLQTQIMKQGLILSEYPSSTSPRPYYFPQRNRIIAGLCDNLVVTQARKRSGTLITAELALQENRNVWAVPGPITSALSQGCNQLIDAGARPYLDADKFIDAVLVKEKI
ncbi:DNA-processing protein DprA [Bombilactobacillus bombi]|uniref:DNA-processing protein DprA n=1 Tax=Bombilactobacillus bombi TaxID=1303590 RepID=UPI0015E60092|nr:DNA-processing protein DprA [Bombilactobacillus bombi]MBA1435067.1 DNA-protecting protein DprA [Bombilactobacillus bombi]